MGRREFKKGFSILVFILIASLTFSCGNPSITQVGKREEILQDTITTIGYGTASGEPGEAKILIAIETASSMAEKALDKNNKIANKVIEALKNFGVSNRDIETSGFNLWPYQPEISFSEGEVSSEGFRARHQLMITTKNIKEVGKIVDLATKEGATNVDNVWFSLKEDKLVRKRAFQKAIEDAKRKAEAIADSMGVKIKKVVLVTEEEGELLYPYPSYAMEKGASELPIAPGEVKISVSVKMTFSY